MLLKIQYMLKLSNIRIIRLEPQQKLAIAKCIKVVILSNPAEKAFGSQTRSLHLWNCFIFYFIIFLGGRSSGKGRERHSKLATFRKDTFGCST